MYNILTMDINNDVRVEPAYIEGDAGVARRFETIEEVTAFAIGLLEEDEVRADDDDEDEGEYCGALRVFIVELSYPAGIAEVGRSGMDMTRVAARRTAKTDPIFKLKEMFDDEIRNQEKFIPILIRAGEIFGSEEKALRWLRAPVPALGDRTPISIMDTPGGMAEVEDVLGAIEHGSW
jgi:putative toxin-antitoxin system antitoxin component (TIGR02293 family)